MKEIVLIIPVLRRPQNAAPLVESARETTPEGRVLFVCSPGDFKEHDACAATGADWIVIDELVRPGDWARKLNAAYRATSEPLLFLGADDIRFHPGWFQAVRRKLDEGAQVVGTNDLGNPRVIRGEHATHLVMTREYADLGTIDRPNCVAHEGYHHEFVDDEIVGTAKARGLWAMALDAHVEHLHPNWGKGESDVLYRAQKSRMATGRKVLAARRGLWEG